MARYKRLFLDGYSYYITMVTYERNPILVSNIDLLRRSFAYAKSRFDFDIDTIVILPDHLHMIIHLPVARDYPKIISTIKRYFSQHLDPRYYHHLIQSHHRTLHRYKPVWQKRFYEHTIRDTRDYHDKVTYIHTNPIKHGLADHIEQWPYGSYHTKHRPRSIQRYHP